MKNWKALTQRILPLLLAVVLLAGVIPATAQAVETTSGFTDVQSSAYYAEAVEWAIGENITNGTTATTFSPDSTVTRQEAVTFLWRAMGRPEPTSSVSVFTDITDRSAYYYDAVLWAAEEGLVNGVGGGLFDRKGTLTYDHIFALLCRASGSDASGSTWSADAVRWAEDNGLTEGLPFSAKAGCPRRDVVYCLWQQLSDGTEPVDPEEEEDPADPEQPGLPDEAGATLTITTGFLDKRSAIDISDFNLEASQAEALAREIADVDGANPYHITSLNAYEQDGQIAKTLAVYYTSSPISVTTVAASDWRYVSDAALEEAERVVDEVVTSNMSDYDVVKALHDYLVLNCDYDQRLYTGNMPFLSHQAEGALLEGAAVCSGYAKAYETLLDTAGIPCETITGYANGYHAWNLVELDGEWYHVDATWDDPTNRGGDYIRYTYFLKSDLVMVKRSHRNWEDLHACTSTKYDEDLLNSVDQAIADEREKDVSGILDACISALPSLPTWTQEELQALSDEALSAAQTVVIDLSDSGYDSNTLSKYRYDVIEAITERYPDLARGSFNSREMCFEFRRTSVEEEIQRRREVKQEEQEQQQAQQEAEDAAAALEIQGLLEEAIAEMNCETQTITLTGYTDRAIKLACDNMRTAGYSFGDYTYSSTWNVTDYNLSAKSGGVVTLTNKKWAAEEEQRYLDQIDEALDNGENRIELQPGSYADGKAGSYYASRAATAAKASGYTTPGGLVCGADYEVTASGRNVDTGIFSLTIRYLNPVTLTVEDYVQRIMEAIEERKTYVVFQYQEGDDSLANIEAATKTFWDEKPTVDGLDYGTGYGLTRGTNYDTQTCSITIRYYE